MRMILIAAAVAAAGTAATVPAHAISRYNVDNKTCAEAQAIVARDGAAILRYSSRRSGQTLFDRYVASSYFCPGGQYAKITSIPTVDANRCVMYHCRDFNFDDGRGVWRP